MNIDRLRSRLQERGLLDAERKLTPAGNAYCIALLADLKRKARAAIEQ